MEPVQIIPSETRVTHQSLRPPELVTSWPRPAEKNMQQIKRFLKCVLPSIPILVFSVDFLYGYITEANFDLDRHLPINETPPFLGALLAAIVASLLCVFIYQGVLKILDETAQS